MIFYKETKDFSKHIGILVASETEKSCGENRLT